MKKFWIVPVAALAFGSACGDSSTTRSTEPKFAPGGFVRDDIYNGLDNSIDATVESISLTAGGSNGSVTLKVQARNDDLENGCNFQGTTEKLTVNVISSDPNIATVSPSTLTFGSCGDGLNLNVHPVAQGSVTVTLEQTSNNTGGNFNLQPATFTVNVASASVTDATPPVIGYVLTPSSPDGSNGWYKSDVKVDWTVTDGESSVSSSTGCDDFTISADQSAQTYTCSATSTGGSNSVTTVAIKRDATAPSVQYTSETPADGSNGWYQNPVIVTFTGSDLTSGLTPLTQTASSGTAEGQNVTVSSPAFTDNAGNNTAAGAASGGPYKVDLSDPTNVTFSGSLASGGSYYFGSVPSEPTCTADDAVSGLASCNVTGYSTTVGGHTVTATATDNAGRTATATLSYTVLAWTLSGFYQPVDMGTVVNTVKAGSTVPLKFEIFAGSTELTATSNVKSFSATTIACDALSPTDEVEVTSTGGTSLRYDATAGQFIQNWQTPKTPGTCYRTSITTLDGSRITATFRLK
jgi:hypothetical protein